MPLFWSKSPVTFMTLTRILIHFQFSRPQPQPQVLPFYIFFFFFGSWEFTWFCFCLFQSKTMLPLQSTPVTLQSTPLSINKELQWKLPMSQHYCLLGRGKELLVQISLSSVTIIDWIHGKVRGLVSFAILRWLSTNQAFEQNSEKKKMMNYTHHL